MRLRMRQASLLVITVGHPSDEIMLLDYKPNGEGDTLYSLIMRIHSLNPETPGNYFMQWAEIGKGELF